MIAAIYARKSTDQSDVADEAKSVTRQVEHATAYAERKGWTVDPRFVFVDDAKSGADFTTRDGLNRLLAALGRKAPFDVLVISEDSVSAARPSTRALSSAPSSRPGCGSWRTSTTARSRWAPRSTSSC